MNKKMWFLSAGLMPLAIAPIATVISCGSQSSSILENFKFVIIKNIQDAYTEPNNEELNKLTAEIKTKFSNKDLGFEITDAKGKDKDDAGQDLKEDGKKVAKITISYKITIGNPKEPTESETGDFVITIPRE